MLEEIGQQPEIGHLNPETSEPRTRELTPKIKRININKIHLCFVNYLWDITLAQRAHNF